MACCPSCVWADIHAGLKQDTQTWWNTLMLLLACPTLTWIFGAMGKDLLQTGLLHDPCAIV